MGEASGGGASEKGHASALPSVVAGPGALRAHVGIGDTGGAFGSGGASEEAASEGGASEFNAGIALASTTVVGCCPLLTLSYCAWSGAGHC